MAIVLGACGGGGGSPAPEPPGDTTPPTVTSNAPLGGATDVAWDANVSVVFSELMDEATLTVASFTLEVAGGGAGVTGAVQAAGDQATFLPAADLLGDTEYVATISTAVTDVAGNALALAHSWSFTTVAPEPVPRLGAHALSYHLQGPDQAPITTTMDTTAGSTILVCAARGNLWEHALPTDNMGNSPYVQLGTAHAYTNWPSSGTALYAFPAAQGGAGHVVTLAKPSPTDEVTMAAVEVLDGGVIQDVQWNEVLAAPLTSLSVTTTGPATLVAVWWGDAGIPSDKTATPNNGFTVIDSVLQEGALIQCAVAAKEVEAAGTYDVTWTATPLQGAQLWLVAVQRAP